MNYKVVFSILGKALLIEAVLLIVPMFVGIIYQENNYLSFLIPILCLMAVGIPLALLKTKDNSLYAKEGFVIVSLTWIVLSLFGALPFVISGTITNYIDALFETISGFSTTGASILSSSQIESLSKAISFWRLFTHWIGGMGILVFVLAIMPANNAGVMHVFRTESTGPSVGKLVSKLRFTARILYGIYVGLTLLEVVLLRCGGLNLFDSFVMSFSTAGTGGFGVLGDSAISYSSYVQIVIAVFMLIFSINFNVYFLILIGSVGKVFLLEEVRVYVLILIASILIITINLMTTTANAYATFGVALKHAFFQVTSISSTTGLVSCDFNLWPTLSKCVLFFLMIVGACGGSTGGGIKVSRLMILCKSSTGDLKKMLHPHAVKVTKIDGEVVSKETERNVRTYLIFWLIIVILTTLLISIEGKFDLLTNFSASVACISNVGPGFEAVGPMSNYMGYSYFSKIVLSLVMLVGRLEIFPILFLFIPRTWEKV